MGLPHPSTITQPGFLKLIIRERHVTNYSFNDDCDMLIDIPKIVAFLAAKIFHTTRMIASVQIEKLSMLVVLGLCTSLKDTGSDADLMDAKVIAQRQMHPIFGMILAAQAEVIIQGFMHKLFHLMFSFSHKEHLAIKLKFIE